MESEKIKEFEGLVRDLNKIKNKKAELEGNLNALIKRKDQMEKDIKEDVGNIDNLEAKIERMSKGIDEELNSLSEKIEKANGIIRDNK